MLFHGLDQLLLRRPRGEATYGHQTRSKSIVFREERDSTGLGNQYGPGFQVFLCQQALSPGHESDQDQAREYQSIGLRFRDNRNTQGDNLSLVIDADRAREKNSGWQLDQRIEVCHVRAMGAGDKSVLIICRCLKPPHHLPDVIEARSFTPSSTQRPKIGHADAIGAGDKCVRVPEAVPE